MTAATFQLQVDLPTIAGPSAQDGRVRIEPLANEAGTYPVVDPDTGKMYVAETYDLGRTGSRALVLPKPTDMAPAGYQYRATVTWREATGRYFKSLPSVIFSVPADTTVLELGNLVDVEFVPPQYVPALLTARDEAVAAAVASDASADAAEVARAAAVTAKNASQTSAGNAATSETNAHNSQTAAATSATNAAASKTAADADAVATAADRVAVAADRVAVEDATGVALEAVDATDAVMASRLGTDGTASSDVLNASYDPKVAARATGTGRTVRREFADANRTASKWREVYGTADFSGTKDPVHFIGWNADRGLGGGDAGEGAIYLGLEAHYHVNIGGVTDVMEGYFDVRPNGATDGGYATFRPFAFTAGKASTDRWAQVQIDIGTDSSATKSQFNLLGGNGSGVQRNLLHIDSTQSVLYVPLTVSSLGGAAPLTLDSSATGNSPLQFADSGTTEWQMVRFHGDQKLYLWNAVNSRSHMEFTRGSTNAAAQTDLRSQLYVHELITTESGILLQGGTGFANTTANITFATGATQRWQRALYQGDTNLYDWDLVNNRFQVRYSPGANSGAAVTTFQSQIVTDGGVKVVAAATILESTATQNSHLFFRIDGTDKWYLANFRGDANHYLWNQNNNRFHVKYTPGSTDAGALTEFQSSVKVDGNVGFYGTTPVAKPTVTGSRGSNAALASLLTALASQGILTDSSS